jgi:hypothetical protein
LAGPLLLPALLLTVAHDRMPAKDLLPCGSNLLDDRLVKSLSCFAVRY